MTSDTESRPSPPPTGEWRRADVFATTHWSVVLTAGRGDSSRAKEALARLCQVYWYPLYAYARRRGCAIHDAEDLTQSFFERLLEHKTLARITRDRGKFRSFLLASFNHFLADEWKKGRAQKRGGGQVVSLDAREAETRYGRELADMHTPERLFEQNWALALLETVFEQLRLEYERFGKGPLFAELKFGLTGERNSIPYAELAEKLGIPENTLKVNVHRLRARYRELLRAEVAHTVATPDEVEEELRYLFRVLGGNR